MVIRGGEVSRLTVSEAIKGLEDAWYRDTDIVNEGDENFTRKIKTMMVLGKTKRTEIYVPEDCIRAILILNPTHIWLGLWSQLASRMPENLGYQ